MTLKLHKFILQEQEEVSTVSSTSPLDDRIDSGIENYRSSTDEHSPANSIDQFPCQGSFLL